MPFQSEKQRRYLHANHPEIAKRWERDYADGGITRIPFFKGAQADTAKGQAMSPGTSASGGTRHGGGGGNGGDGPPSVVHKPTGPTAEQIAAAKAKAEAEKRRLEAEAHKKHLKSFKDTQTKKVKLKSKWDTPKWVDTDRISISLEDLKPKKTLDDYYYQLDETDVPLSDWEQQHLQELEKKNQLEFEDEFKKKENISNEKLMYPPPGNLAKLEGPALIQMRTLEKKKALEEYGGPTFTPQDQDTLNKLQKMDVDQNKVYKMPLLSAEGGVARKKYSTGGILDITGEEEITTEEGNDISLVDESETGVSTLFRAKNGGYAIQGGGPNYLGKQPEVKVPRYWKSSPDHPDTELAYITEPEKQVLIDLNLHGGLEDGKPNTGPNGVISLQGDMGSIGGGSGTSGGNNEDKGSDHGHSRFDPGSGYYGGTTTPTSTGGDNYPDPIITLAETKRKEDLKNLVETGPGSDVEKYDTDLVGMTDAEKYNARRNMIKSKYTATSSQRKNALTDNYNQEKERLEKAMKGSFLKTLAFAAVGIPPTLDTFVSVNPFGEKKLTGLGPQAYELQQLKNQHIADLTSMKDDLLAGVDITNPNEMRNLEETTNFTEIMNDLEELTRVKDEDEDTKGDTPEVPVVAPVTEEIEDSYAMAGDWLQTYRDLKAKQALSAQLQEKWADEREWQQNTMFANSGGLANLFRVKNY